MSFYEVLFIIVIISFVVFIFGREIYRKIKKLPSGECAGCHSRSKKLLKEYHKKYGKKSCSCSK
jgi:hypothetical protein